MAVQLRVYPASQEEPGSDRPPPTVGVRLRDLLPLVALAQRNNYLWLQDFLDDEVLDFLVLDVGGVLGGDNDVDDADGLAVFVLDRDLGFGIGAEPGDFAGLADAVELAAKAMGKHDRRGH